MQAGVPANAIVVYGIPVQDGETASLIKKVMNVSAIISGLVLISVIFNIVSSEWTGLIGLIYLGIPACGYFGAKDRRRDLLSYFKWCNALCALCNLLGAGSTLLFTLPVCNSDEIDCSQFMTAIYVSLVLYIIGIFADTYACMLGGELYEKLLVQDVARASGAMAVAAAPGQPIAAAAPPAAGGYPTAQAAAPPAAAGYPVAQ